MDILDINLLRRVEKALNLELKDWQINYILSIPMVLDMSITSRQTGKTTAYIIKLLFSSDEPIEVYNDKMIWSISDDYHVRGRLLYKDERYTNWFRDYLINIHQQLISAGITPRKIFYNIHEKMVYERKIREWK